MSSMSRIEHLQWAKDRALEYVESGDLLQALASMLSDLGKHPELVDHPGKFLGVQLSMAGQSETPNQMRKFIKEFN